MDAQHECCNTFSKFANNALVTARIVDAGGAEAAVRAMFEHPVKMCIQMEGALTLSAFDRNADSAARIVDAGGVAAVVQAICEHPANMGTEPRLLQNLALRIPGFAEKVVKTMSERRPSDVRL